MNISIVIRNELEINETRNILVIKTDVSVHRALLSRL